MIILVIFGQNGQIQTKLSKNMIKFIDNRLQTWFPKKGVQLSGKILWFWQVLFKKTPTLPAMRFLGFPEFCIFSKTPFSDSFLGPTFWRPFSKTHTIWTQIFQNWAKTWPLFSQKTCFFRGFQNRSIFSKREKTVSHKNDTKFTYFHHFWTHFHAKTRHFSHFYRYVICLIMPFWVPKPCF